MSLMWILGSEKGKLFFPNFQNFSVAYPLWNGLTCHLYIFDVLTKLLSLNFLAWLVVFFSGLNAMCIRFSICRAQEPAVHHANGHSAVNGYQSTSWCCCCLFVLISNICFRIRSRNETTWGPFQLELSYDSMILASNSNFLCYMLQYHLHFWDITVD